VLYNSGTYVSGLIKIGGVEMIPLFRMLPYLVTLIVLIITSVRKKRENQPPASLGNSYFREDR
jgi:simple sugar transport system permease protein